MGDAEVIPHSSSKPDSAGEELDRMCESCGYNLRGLMENRCPECGREFDPLRKPLARIPWLHRKEIGLISAYFGTVFQILFHPRKFCDEFHRPNRIPTIAGEKFRLVNIWIGVASVTALPAILIIVLRLLQGAGAARLEWLVAAVLLMGMGTFVYVFCRMALVLPPSTAFTFGIPAFAVILDYASAPLILSPLWSLPGSFLFLSRSFSTTGVIGTVYVLVGGGIAGLVWMEQIILLSIAGRFEWSRILHFAMRLALHWLFSTIIAAIIAFLVLLMAGITAATVFH